MLSGVPAPVESLLHAKYPVIDLSPPPLNKSPDFVQATMRICGSFITSGNPSTPSIVADGASSNNTMMILLAAVHNLFPPYQMDLNVAGGIHLALTLSYITTILTKHGDPGLMNGVALLTPTHGKRAQATDATCGGALEQPYLKQTQLSPVASRSQGHINSVIKH